jgi:hypothetical protein
MSIDHMNWSKVIGPNPDRNTEQDAVDILDKTRAMISTDEARIKNDIEWCAYMTLVHAANYLWSRG